MSIRSRAKEFVLNHLPIFDIIYPTHLRMIGSTKHQTIQAYAKRFGLRTFVETGLFYGNTVALLRRRFSRLISIELDPVLCERAKRRFQSCPRIEIIHGDSATELPKLLPNLSEPCLFWLDAHYWTGATFPEGAMDRAPEGHVENPVLIELGEILQHRIQNHVILIDDADHFTGEAGWPTIATVGELVSRLRPELICEVQDRIVRIHGH